MSKNISPLPWFSKRVGSSTVYIESRLRDGWLREVAACGPTEAGSEQQDANAAFIVKAVNAYDQLVTALEMLLENIEEHRGNAYSTFDAEDMARTALAAAEGE